MTFISPFVQQLQLKLTPLSPGYYSVMAVNDVGLITPPESWMSQLFYQYEANFYGLTVSTENRDIRLSLAELLDVLSPTYKHPFLKVHGADAASETLLENLQEASVRWADPALFAEAIWRDEGFSFPNDAGDLLATAAMQTLGQKGIAPEEMEALLPYFRSGGWPLRDKHIEEANVKVALRLSEPSEDERDWLLETVLMTTTERHWTPAVRKRQAPIVDALPEKWKTASDAIEAAQKQMCELLSIAADGTRFLFERLTDADVKVFLQRDIALLQALGFEVILPAWLKQLKQSKMRVQVNASQSSRKSVASLDDVLTFKWQFSMNGADISADKFQELVAEKREFIRIGTEWFRIDAVWMQQMRDLMAKAENEQWTVKQLLFQELPETLVPEDENDETEDDPLFAFTMQQSLKNYVQQLQEKQGLPPVAVPPELEATLRPYQQQGFEWLVFMREQQFGACLADDMGLGKTVQTISYLLHTFQALEAEEPALIICPTSVLGNWQKELARFAPSLEVYTHYGAGRLRDEMLAGKLRDSNVQVVLSTFGTVTQDAEFLQQLAWSSVILDEAQNIKNMQTMQSRAIRKLRGTHHIALTGTPVENRLAELWAIFDFIHKGYLGSFATFQKNYILPIERDEAEREKEQLRAKIQPFLLRRTKRDKKLMLNLPDKQEMNEFCPLTTEQAALYEGYITETAAQLEQLTGFEKRGRILKMLNQLKQLCNHPALYLKEPIDDAHSLLKRSVKLQRIVDLVAEIIESGEQCLIFTQYIGMGQILQQCFAELYDIDAPFLTGSMPKQQRDILVDAFQAKQFPIFILSLKAGGTGLNLTAANHVLHADRWWNPAVENQATDRAYRIGQTQFVQVHKFMTLGTIEEKIDQMLTQKSALSEELIQSSKWITELEDGELQALFALG